ncbi:MAG: enoyl-CoA hydratase/isomerase family protein [Dehalococcoidia bacterium]|nr:enoyl-CoA hydratase/isomerase family protein [Dehalococcoidia bacterium]MCB9483729.1 enoyl-CoA hydratase/isomerase family protein [Dehalococcoidia bacterium]
MDEPRVTYRTIDDGRIAIVSLNRPRYRNALSLQTMQELDNAFQEAARDPEVRVAILRGEGPAFSAGHDLGSPDVANRGETENRTRAMYERTWDLDIDHYLRFRSLPIPTIAAVHGHCILAGWMLASSMDVIFAAEDAEFLMSDIEYFSMPWDIGVRRTKGIVFENRFLTAEEVQEMGFVYQVVPAADLEDVVIEYARRVAEQDKFRLRLMKLSLNQMQDMMGFSTHIIGHHTGWAVSRSGSLPPERDKTASRQHGIVAHARTAPKRRKEK